MKLRIPRSALTAILLGLGLMGCDAMTSTEKRLARAEQALEAGRLEAAVSDARAVLEKDDNSAAAWLLMARIGLKYGDGDAALRDLGFARRDGADPRLVRALHDEAMLLARRHQELLDLEVPTEESNTPEHQVAIATALAALSRLDEARATLDAVLARDPDHTSARMLNIRLLRGAGDVSGARAALHALLQDHPALAQALMLKGQYELSVGEYSAAAESFSRALGASAQLNLPEQILLLGALVEARLAAGDLPGAAASVAQLKSRAPRWPITDQLAARVALAQGDAATAVSTLQALLARDPEQHAARVLLGAALLERGAVEQARSQLIGLLAEQPENVEARKVLARLYMQSGDSSSAERVLTELPAGVASDPTADWMRSSILAMSGRRSEALSLLEQAARSDADNVPLQLDLARTYLAAGRREDSARVLAAIPAQKSGLAGRQLLVLNAVAGVPESEAVKLLLALADEQPEDALQRTVIGQTLMQLGHTEAAREQFAAALNVDAHLTLAREGLAAAALRQGDLETAEQYLLQVVELEPGAERAYLGLAAIANRRNDTALSRQWLERGIGAVPGGVDARMALAELLFLNEKPDAAEALLTQALNLADNKPQVLVGIGLIQQRAGRYARAAAAFDSAFKQRPEGLLAIRLYEARQQAGQEGPDAVLRQWLQSHPDDLPVRATLAAHLLSAGELQSAKGEYERLVQRAATPVFLNNLAWVYQSTGDARAESTAKRAYQLAPDNASIADTYGWILLERGRPSEALPLLEKAAKALPDNQDVQDHYRRARELAGGSR